jgi:nucleotide-binding universal stress UspA family protein
MIVHLRGRHREKDGIRWQPRMNVCQERESGTESGDLLRDMEKKGDPKQRSVRRPTQPLGDRAKRDSFKIDNLLVPLDFSRPSFKALEYALPLAERFGAKLHLVHAFDYDYPMSTFSAMPLAIPEAEIASRAKRRLQDVAKKYAIALVPENCHVVKGRAYHAVCQLARKLETGLIVTTTRGHTGLQHVFLGSTTERIVQHAPCGVLVVREHEREFVRASEGAAKSQSAIRLKKILVPVDFSDCSMVGLQSAVRFAQVWGAQLVTFNCVPLQTFAIYGEYGGRDLTALTNYAQKAAKEEMDEVVSSVKSQDIIVEGVIELGVPALAICDYARNNEIDLIVTATHGSTGLTHIVLGSTAEQVVRYAHCPVLVMPSYARGAKRE